MEKTNDAFVAFACSHMGTGRINPYWTFDNGTIKLRTHADMDEQLKEENPDLFGDIPFDINTCKPLLHDVRTYFQLVYNSWHSEAQVLCVSVHDAQKLHGFCIPCLPKTYSIMGEPVKVFVLPQDNTGGNSCISENCWQQIIVNQNIYPLARIHSHHILDAYQSGTDYATLNSNTLEMVLGHIFETELHVGFWLDVYDTNTKDNVWVATETAIDSFDIAQIPCGHVRASDFKWNF